MKPIIPIIEYLITPTGDKDTPRYWCHLPGGKHVRRSRLIMMNFLHTKHLPSKLQVHHINRNTLDDRIENLALVTRKMHQSIHLPKDYKFGASYSENPTEYERGRRKQPHVKKAVSDASLRWYHRNKDKITNNPDKKEYKKQWYLENKERIKNKMKIRYLTDEGFRKTCIVKAKEYKQKRRSK
jgi:hypothetical protein